MINEKILWAKNVFLRQKCVPVNIQDKEELTSAQLIIYEMFRTLYADPSSVALAAPQVGINLQITTIDYEDRDTKKRRLLALINPNIVHFSDETIDDQEICLSVPNFTGYVPRAKSIEVEAYDQHGRFLKFSAEDFFARVLQHEIDHLNGFLYIDKLRGELEKILDYPERRIESTMKSLNWILDD